MPRSTREYALRELTAACNNIDWAQKHLLQVVNRYIDEHPEIAKPLHDLLPGCDLLKVAIMNIRGSI